MNPGRYTLVIPTYNRPVDLARQLRFLAHQKADFPVLVLDSSSDDNHQSNRAGAAGLALDLRLERFDPVMPPFEKFWRGAEMVRTEFSSLCADDDFVLVPAVAEIVEFLEHHPDHSAAHGWYFQFYLEHALGLTSFLYRSPSIDSSDWTRRLFDLLSRYEAITYAVHRTSVLQRVLLHVQSMQTMLARELLGGAMVVVAGKVARLPVVYSGRSLGPSVAYANWHPVEALARSPSALFEQYARQKVKLLEYAKECGHPGTDSPEVERAVDLAHLRYASDYFRPEFVDYLFSETARGTPVQRIMDGFWPLLSNRAGLVGALHRSSVLRELRKFLVGALHRSSVLRELRKLVAPGLREHHVRKVVAPNSYVSLPGTTASGRSRGVEVYEAFRNALAGESMQPAEAKLIEALAGYE